MFFVQEILRDSGYRSEIFCDTIETRLQDKILWLRDYEDNPEDLLLVHYSLGTYHDEWIDNLRSRTVLIYHNITPARFFEEGSKLRYLVDSGRHRLSQWAKSGRFRGAIADSRFNAAELMQWGYSNIESIPLLVDLNRVYSHCWHKPANISYGSRNILFVGRICENKGQGSLVQMLYQLSRVVETPVRLLLAGAVISGEYEQELHRMIQLLRLEDSVKFLGRLEDEELYGFYRAADLYVSMSEHEGFGMPLVEAMAFDVPVLAFATGGVAEALGPGGILVRHSDPGHFAALARIVLEEPALRRQIVNNQRKALRRYERQRLVDAFHGFLRQIGFDVTLQTVTKNVPPSKGHWLVEGPFEGSYSLAIVNRELARALERTGESVALVSRDGPGVFPPSHRFLQANHDIARMAELGQSQIRPEICLRNQYPPHVHDMQGTIHVLANYAWEESAFPKAWVSSFNTTLDLITVTSSYVAKVLRDNGVHVPIHVVGNGINQMLSGIVPAPNGTSHRGRFRFFHVSSGFPRKGLDVLLEAWADAFTSTDEVELVIKTFPNIHNHIEADLKIFVADNPNVAPIKLINADIDIDAMRELYGEADALVCPSRGEGFGLPLAEGMALGKSIITTAYGGQSDFCTEKTAWLCDYTFAYAKTHLSEFDSVWVEPNRISLAQALQDVFRTPMEARRIRSDAGRDWVLKHYTWDSVAIRTRDAVKALRCAHFAHNLRLPNIGLVSTWNTRCGIAAYAKALTSGFEPERLHVFAASAEPLCRDEPFVRRCWVQGWEDPLDDLFQQIVAANIDAVVVQFNFGFFKLESLANLIERLHDRGVLVLITLHSTMDVVRPDTVITLRDIGRVLSTVCRVLVHSVHDLNRLKDIGLVENVTLFPMGVPRAFNGNRINVRRSMGLEGRTVIATYGYLLPNKGLRQLIGAVGLLRERISKVHLLMLNALYPVPESEEEMRACKTEIMIAGLADQVTMITDFLEEESDVITRLSAADVVVFPYQVTQESASAAVKTGLSSLSPVAVTPLPVFADVAGVSYSLPGTMPADLACGLEALLCDERQKVSLLERQRSWVESHAWLGLSARLDGLIRGELCTKDDFRYQKERCDS